MPAEKIRVLHVITRLVLGGAQQNTVLTTALLDRARYAVTLVSGPTIGAEGSIEDQIPRDITFHRVPELVREPHPAKDVIALCRLYKLIRRGRYHIVHTHMTKAGILGRIAARLARTPIVIHTPHGHAFHDYLAPTGAEALKRVERWLTGWAERTVCLTRAERDDYIRFRIGPPQVFEIIHSGVDLERFRRARGVPDNQRHTLGLPAEGPLVTCVARLVPVKGVQYLLEAVPLIRASVPQATIVFVGDGSLRADLERRAAELGLDGAVRFLGLRKDVPEIVKLSDIVVLPSLNEGMGRAAVEALAAGRPVVASRVGGIQDVVADGETGVLVPPADPIALARAIVRVITSPGLARVMGDRAQQSVDEYGIESMVKKIDDLYMRLLISAQRAGRVSEAGASKAAAER